MPRGPPAYIGDRGYDDMGGGFTVYSGRSHPPHPPMEPMPMGGRRMEAGPPDRPGFSSLNPQSLYNTRIENSPPPSVQKYQASFGDTNGKPMPGKESGTPERGIIHLLNIYADKASLNGVIFIKSSKYIVVKCIWAILLFGSLGVMFVHLNELAKKFYLYEKQSNVNLKFENLQFPAVTICNANPVRNSQLHKTSQALQDLVDTVNPDSLSNFVDDWEPSYEDDYYYYDDNGNLVEDDSYYERRKKRSTTNDINRSANVSVQHRSDNFLDDFNFTTFDDGYYNDYSNDQFSGSWEAESEEAKFDGMQSQFLSLYSKENGTIRNEVGHQIQRMLVQCSFSGRKCVSKNFTLVATATFGNCYTIQYEKFVAKNSGPRNGLSLIIFLEPDEYIPGISNAKGGQAVVHDYGTLSFPDDEGVAFGAGMETSIGLTRITISRLNEPHGECTSTSELEDFYGVKYTRQTCQEICMMENVMNTCDCYDKNKPITFTLFKDLGTLKPCQSTLEMNACMIEMTFQFHVNESCSCASPCKEVKYKRTLSSRPWPNSAFAKLMAKTVCKEKGAEKHEICTNADMMTDMALRENFALLKIYFESLNYESIEEDEAYTEFQFISDIGGTVGLYVGLSVLSAFEIIHLLMAICRYVCFGNWVKDK